IAAVHAAYSSVAKIDRFRQPIAATLFPSRFCRVELIETETCHNGHEVGAWRLDMHLPAAPAQPRLLHHVFRASEIAEHPVRMRHEQRSMRFEDLEVSVGRVGHQNGFASISTVIAATSTHMAYAI